MIVPVVAFRFVFPFRLVSGRGSLVHARFFSLHNQSMTNKGGRPTTERGRALASKERALAHLRWYQLRILRKEYRPVADFEATLGSHVSMIRDRLFRMPDHLPELTGTQREAVRRAIRETLEACSRAEL